MQSHFDYQSLPPRSHIGSSLFRKINWLPTVECCFANTIFKYSNRIVPGYIHEMFQPSLCRYSTRLQMTLGMPLRKTNTGQKNLSFLGPKYGQKETLVSNIVFFYASSNFFLVIISILLSRSSYFNLAFPSIFCLIPLRGTLMEISTFRSFFRFPRHLRSGGMVVYVVMYSTL